MTRKSVSFVGRAVASVVGGVAVYLSGRAGDGRHQRTEPVPTPAPGTTRVTPTTIPTTVLPPLQSDGTGDPAVPGRCRDVSAGGVCFSTAESIKTRYAYVEFGGVTATAGLAVLMKVARSQSLMSGGTGNVYAGPFRLDL